MYLTFFPSAKFFHFTNFFDDLRRYEILCSVSNFLIVTSQFETYLVENECSSREMGSFMLKAHVLGHIVHTEKNMIQCQKFHALRANFRIFNFFGEVCFKSTSFYR